MRETNFASVQFAQGDPGNIQTVQELLRYVQDLERRTALAVAALASGQKDVLHVEPARPRWGLTVNADGTDWNPGGGEGVYFYNSMGQWIQLG
jgi:hypothetical protein